MKAIIMTGGKGMRMAPYTKVLPKGLLPVGDQPILEIIIKQLHMYGFRSITMACGYLAPLIQTYFGDGSKWNVAIEYQVEQEALGTVGPLKLMKDIDTPFLVMNCDVLTTLNLQEMWSFHKSGNSPLTIASQKKKIPIELGVLETNGDQVINFVEKPTRSAHVSMGMYVMNPELMDYIPDGKFFDVPDLIHALLADRKSVRHFENESYWLDIGRPADYSKANEQFPTIEPLLFPGGNS
jgi:NDP-sugar pyrophosphorylase family protein